MNRGVLAKKHSKKNLDLPNLSYDITLLSTCPPDTPPIHSSSSYTTTPYIPIPIPPVLSIPNSPQMRYCTCDNADMEYLMGTAPGIKLLPI